MCPRDKFHWVRVYNLFLYVTTIYFAKNILWCQYSWRILMSSVLIIWLAFGIRTILNSWIWKVSPPLFFGKSLWRIGIISSLTIWKNCLVKPLGSELFFVRRFVINNSISFILSVFRLLLKSVLVNCIFKELYVVHWSCLIWQSCSWHPLKSF